MSSPPTIYYLAPCVTRPRGGIKQIYRHVEILRRHGYDAWVLHPLPGFRAEWFRSDAPVIDAASFRARFRVGHDCVVLSEDLGEEMLVFPPRRIIFDQNVYYGLMALGEDAPRRWPHLECDAVLCVSEHNEALLRYAYPSARILRVQIGVDAAVFRPRPLHAKKRQIVCVAAKGAATNHALFQVLSARARGSPGTAACEWVFVRNRSEVQMAEILADSLICVFASVEEGFGLVPVEAILSGCIVLTHGSGPQPEYAPPRFLFPDHDIVGMANAIEAITRSHPDGLADWQVACDAARARVLASCSLEREEASVLAAWKQLIT